MLIGSGAGATPVEAHIHVLRSDPPTQAVLPTAAETVSIWFSERLEPAATTARPIDQRGIVRKVGEFQWQATTRVETTSKTVASGADGQSAPWHLGDLAILGLTPLMLIVGVTGYWIAMGRRSGAEPEADENIVPERPLQSEQQARLRPRSERR